MKKFLALTLAILSSLMLLASCDSADKKKEITDPNTPETFTFGDLSLTLPGDFATAEESRVDANSYTIANETYTVRIYRISKSTITPNPGYAFPTITEFYEMHLGSKAQFREVNGITCADHERANSSSDIFVRASGKQLVTLHETDADFWSVSFHSPTVAYEEVEKQAMEWLKTLTFQTAAESGSATGTESTSNTETSSDTAA